MGTRIAVARQTRAFVLNERGNVAMLFALACMVIFPLAGFAVDLSRVLVEKQKLQQATDAAALAAAHDAFMSADERRDVIEAHLNHLEVDLGREIEYDLSQDSEGRISLVTRISVNTTLAKIMGVDEVDVTVRSDAVEGGADIEVAMVLDITGSMSGSRITALKEAAEDLVEIVVKDEQEPYYSKVSMVPYSVAVNVGSYAEDVRGPIIGGRAITASAWQTGATRNISGASKTNPVRITSNAHGFSNGDRVWIDGVNGMHQLNRRVFTVSSVDANTFRLQGVNGNNYSNYSSGGTIRECVSSNCEVNFTSNAHGHDDGDYIVISGVGGMNPSYSAASINTGNNVTWRVTNVSENAFALSNSVGPYYSNYTSGGTNFCTLAGCEWFRFNNAYNGTQRLHRISTCATERTGDEAYTDAPPSESYVGRGYLSNANACPANAILPLTDDREALIDAIDDLEIGGSTAGHMGAAWGFYTLSPNFGSIFPAENQPAMYGRPKLHKFAVFMTDGDFNSSFCQGVLSRTSTSGSGSTQDQINCDSENGTSFSQAASYCTAMKQAGIKVYTVGFEVTSNALRDAVRNCATSPQYAHFPSGSEELISVFNQIGRDINEVRLVK